MAGGAVGGARLDMVELGTEAVAAFHASDPVELRRIAQLQGDGYLLGDVLGPDSGVETGSVVDLRVVRGKLIATPVRGEYELQELLSGVSKASLHDEVDSGEAVGRGLVTARTRIPDRSDVVWINLDPRLGHEQRGRRPALVLSHSAYNRKVGVDIMCPITSAVKGYPFEVAIPDGLGVSGVVLADQVKSLDWRARRAEVKEKLPSEVTEEVLAKLNVLLS